MEKLKNGKTIVIKCNHSEDKKSEIIYTICRNRRGLDIIVIKQELYDSITGNKEPLTPAEFYKLKDEIFQWVYDKVVSDLFVDIRIAGR